MILSNFYFSAPPRALLADDGVALHIALEDFPDKEDSVPFTPPLLAVKPQIL